MTKVERRRAQAVTRGLASSAPSKTSVLLSAETAATALALDLGKMIESARQQVAQAANAALTTLYWQIGTRIRQDVLKQRRAEYGAQIVAALGRQLEERFGRGFGDKSLWRMLQFAETLPDPKIVAALRRQLNRTNQLHIDGSCRFDGRAPMICERGAHPDEGAEPQGRRYWEGG